jgi:type I restriction enzyme S subunit
MVQIREPESFVLAQGVYGFKVNNKVIPAYLVQLSNTSWYRKLANSIMVGSTQVHITNTAFKLARIPLPAIAEQGAIAEALSDADALIDSLDQLIAKKRDLKQGAMQELLTGKKRLPGFSGEWAVKPLGEVCWFQEGPGVRNTQFTSSGVKLLNGTNIFRGVLNLDSTNRYISEKEAYGAYSHFLANFGDIVIAASGITIERFHEKVAFVGRADLPFCMNTSTIRFRPFDHVLAANFLYQYLTSDTFKRVIGGQATGSAQLNFGPSHLGKISISIPTVAEQTAIATILSDMDSELAELQSRLAKARQIKQGMMQELLTGRIRLL